jgi:hypothetical protein
VWPNVFTDSIYLYKEVEGGNLDATPFDFRAPAAANRLAIAASLRAWQTNSGGRIVSCGSELVDGVTLHGFDATATQR